MTFSPDFQKYSELPDPADASVNWKEFWVDDPQNVVDNDIEVEGQFWALLKFEFDERDPGFIYKLQVVFVWRVFELLL